MSKRITEDEAKEKVKSKWPEWELIEYSGITKPCKLKHACGHVKTYYSFEYLNRKAPFCDECDVVINWKYQIGEILGNIIIINRKTVKVEKKSSRAKNSKYLITKKYYQYQCLKCGFDGSLLCYRNGMRLENHWVEEYRLAAGGQCACCHGTVVQSGINDVATTDPHIVQFFANKDLAFMYSRSATKKIDVQCPMCGFINPKKTTIYNLVWEGVACYKCGDSISYPEKFIYFLLMQLKIDFEIHKTFVWSKHIQNTYNDKFGDKVYDFYIPAYNLVVESHGNQHYDTGVPFCVYGDKGRTLEEEQENDRLKYELAIQNGVNYVVIDCKQSNKQYLSNSILNSGLSQYISLDNVDWEQCNRDAISGIKMMVINEKKNNPDMSTVMLGEKYKFSHTTIGRWLKQGAEICGYNPEEERKKCGVVYAKNFRPIYSPELNMAFKMIKDAAEYIGAHSTSISACLVGKVKHAGRHPVTDEQLSWLPLTLEQYEEWCNFNKQLSI